MGFAERPSWSEATGGEGVVYRGIGTDVRRTAQPRINVYGTIRKSSRAGLAKALKDEAIRIGGAASSNHGTTSYFL
jgi:hypothetical protein